MRDGVWGGRGGGEEEEEMRRGEEEERSLFSRQAGRPIICTFQRVMVENEGPHMEFSSSTFEGGYFK